MRKEEQSLQSAKGMDYVLPGEISVEIEADIMAT